MYSKRCKLSRYSFRLPMKDFLFLIQFEHLLTSIMPSHNLLSELTKITFFDDYRYINLFFRKFDKIMNDSIEFKKNHFYSDKKAGYLNEDSIIPIEINKLQKEIWQHFGDLNDKYLIDFIINKNKTEYDWFKYFYDNNILFSKTQIGNIISTTIIK